MADFGPRVFHALARTVDKSDRHTYFSSMGDVKQAGLNRMTHDMIDDRKIFTTTAIRRLKNALFKLVMLTTRDTLFKDWKDNGPSSGEVYVDIRFTLGDQFVHPDQMAVIDNIKVSFLGGGISGKRHTTKAKDLEVDTEEVIGNISYLAAACGPKQNLSKIFGDEVIYQKLLEVDPD